MHIGFVLLNCDLGAEEYILEELKQVGEIKNAYVTFGAYDIIAEIHAETQEDFEKDMDSYMDRIEKGELFLIRLPDGRAVAAVPAVEEVDKIVDTMPEI